MPKAHSTRHAITGVKACVLSGPISRIDNGNFDAFEDALQTLRREEWKVFSPRHHSLSERCFQEAQELGAGYASGELYRRLMKDCIRAILSADTLFVLPNWEHSNGARIEVLVAGTIGVPVVEFETRQKIVVYQRQLEVVVNGG